MNTKKSLQLISSWFTSLNSWTEKIIKLSVLSIALILILCLWIFLLKYIIELASVDQLYATAFYGIFYLIIWGIVPALGIRILVRVLRHYSNEL